MCAALIEHEIYGVRATVISACNGWVIFEISFDPPEVLRTYPIERVRVTVPPTGPPVAVSLDCDRPFLHRYPRIDPSKLARVRIPGLEFLAGALCLWFPDDPLHLRWSWAKGFVDFVRIVQRHLWYEEFWRRNGKWPVEDAHEEITVSTAKAA